MGVGYYVCVLINMYIYIYISCTVINYVTLTTLYICTPILFTLGLMPIVGKDPQYARDPPLFY